MEKSRRGKQHKTTGNRFRSGIRGEFYVKKKIGAMNTETYCNESKPLAT